LKPKKKKSGKHIGQVTSAAKQVNKVMNREEIYDMQLHFKLLRLIEELK
jgi:hypothetical protein